MENFINLAKQGYEKYQESQGGQQGGQQGQQGGQGYGGQQQGQGYGQENQYGQQGGQGQGYGRENEGYGGGNSYGGQSQGQGIQGGAQYNDFSGNNGRTSGGAGMPDLDDDKAVQHAMGESGEQDSSIFSQGLSFAKQFASKQQQQGNSAQDIDLDEDGIQNAHDQVYNKGNAGGMSSNAIGGAAALQAMKMFTSGSGGQSAGGGGNMQTKVISMAMAEASKMFDQSGGAAQGNKQDAVSSAAQTIMKLMLKSQMGGSTGTGGLGGLMSMASKFM